MNPTNIASRYAPRYDVLLKVVYESLRAPEESDFLSDLSEGGLRLHTRLPFKVGQQLSLNISFPRFVAPIPVLGEVRWVHPGERVGISFSRVPRTAQDQLSALLQRCRQKERNVSAQVSKALAQFRPLRVLVLEGNEALIPDLSKRGGLPGADLISASELTKSWTAPWTSGDVALIDLDALSMASGELLTLLRVDKRFEHFPQVLIAREDSVALRTFVATRPNAMLLRKPVVQEHLLRTLLLVGELKNRPVFEPLEPVPSLNRNPLAPPVNVPADDSKVR